jgi:hypothetical protein
VRLRHRRLPLELSDGSVIVTTSCWPARRPLTICVLLSPLRPTSTCCEIVLPLSSTLTVPSDPLPVRAWLGTVTPWAWLTITAADALIPGLTWESR